MKRRVIPLLFCFLTLGLNIAGWCAFALNFVGSIDLSFELCVTILIINAILIISSMVNAFVYKEYEDGEEEYEEVTYEDEYVEYEYIDEKPDKIDGFESDSRKRREIIDEGILIIPDELTDKGDKGHRRKKDEIPESEVIVFYKMDAKRGTILCQNCGTNNKAEEKQCKICRSMIFS